MQAIIKITAKMFSAKTIATTIPLQIPKPAALREVIQFILSLLITFKVGYGLHSQRGVFLLLTACKMSICRITCSGPSRSTNGPSLPTRIACLDNVLVHWDSDTTFPLMTCHLVPMHLITGLPRPLVLIPSLGYHFADFGSSLTFFRLLEEV